VSKPISVLAISSSVAAGHVGLSATVPTLHACGVEVAALPTVLLSNHPGFAHCEGTGISPETLAAMLDALAANAMMAGVHTVLSGYLPTTEHVAVVERAIVQVRRHSPEAIYICDPILGDDPGGLYIDETAADAIRGHLLPLADVLLPNRFELAWLSQLPVDTPDDAIKAAQGLGIPRVIVTSVPMSESHIGIADVTPDAAVSYSIPRLDEVPKGTGDMLSGLIAAGLPLDSAISTLQATIQLSLGQNHLNLVAAKGGVLPAFAQSIGSASNVTGVDGCPAGWIAVTFPIDHPEDAEWHIFKDFETLVAATAQHKALAIDMPIGLPEIAEAGGRAADREARAKLGDRKSSVFSVPARAAIYAQDYRAACEKALQFSDPPRKVAKQTFNLFPKIREIDALMTPGLQDRVVECHPEVSFWALNGCEPLDQPKKVKSRPYEPGIELRRCLLKDAGFRDEFLVGPVGSSRRVATDDFLDACAAAWSAARLASGAARRMPAEHVTDRKGLRVEIVY